MEIVELLGGMGPKDENWVVGWLRCMERLGNETLPGARLCKATLKTSMQVNADATLVEVDTAGKIPPASTFALKCAAASAVGST